MFCLLFFLSTWPLSRSTIALNPCGCGLIFTVQHSFSFLLLKASNNIHVQLMAKDENYFLNFLFNPSWFCKNGLMSVISICTKYSKKKIWKLLVVHLAMIKIQEVGLYILVIFKKCNNLIMYGLCVMKSYTKQYESEILV